MMFQKQKTIGNFSVTTTFDSPHRRCRGVDRRAIFSGEIIAKQKQVEYYLTSAMPVSEVYKRALKNIPSISINPKRQQGLPCITGTRIPVHLVIWAVEQTGSIEGALSSYPDLSTEQVKDALYFAETILGSQNVLTEAAPPA